jgi:phospholipid transport system substrate-binding protein
MPGRLNRLLGAAFFMVAALFAATPASADAADPASLFIKDLGGRAIGILSDKALATDDRRQQFHTIFVEHFDVPAIGKFVLGRYGRSATPEQMDAYQQVFQDYVVSTYNTRLTSYAGQTLDVVGSAPGEEGRTIVKSRINQPAAGTPPIQVDWILTGTEGSFRIIDVVIGGVSMALTQRSEFGSVIQSGGGTVDALITRLRDQVAAVNSQG